MKNIRFRTYIYWGVTAIAVVGISVALIFLMIHMESLKRWIRVLTEILTPIIYGAVLAYLLNPVYNRVASAVERVCKNRIRDKKKVRTAARICGTLASLTLLIFTVAGLLSMMVPQLITSVKGIIETLPARLSDLEVWLVSFLSPDSDNAEVALQIYNQLSIYVEEWVENKLAPNLDKIISNVSSGLWSGLIVNISTKLWSVIIALKNLLIGMIVMVYVLNIKETFEAQGKKIVYGIFPVKLANKIIEELRFIHKVFGGFIIGKLLDSLIIGIICFVCVNLMNMPYALLVSVIVGATNIIPFFGPFIGAVPSAFLILLVSPMKCLYFLIFILLLQQFDGNILGPKILGDSTGLQSFWVLFSILLFGGLFGFVGMIIGVPAFAVIYRLMKEGIEACLYKKQLSGNTDDYRGLNYIDEEKKTYVRD
ncbi:AI-2E family transporter [Lachnospiraceae bacterium 62-35]